MSDVKKLKETIHQYFEKTITVVFSIMLIFLMLGITIGVAKLFLHLDVPLSSTAITGTYKIIISDVLSLFILIELSRSLVEYFYTKRIRTSSIIDAVIVFVLREIMIKLFEHTISNEEILSLSALLLTLGALRFMANYSNKNGDLDTSTRQQ